MAAVNPRSFCRVSPNEEAHLRHKKLEERRKARLIQVREQEKNFARQVRERVRDKRETERRVLKKHVSAALADAHETELQELESKYLSMVDSVGQGHRDAQQINEEENRLQELRLLLEAKQRWRAQDRHAAAMKELSANQLKERQQKEHSLQTRKQALEVEKERAKRVASADPTPSQMVIMDFEVGSSRHVQFKEAEGYATSYYHIPNPVVERMGTPDSTEPSAQEQARIQIEEDRNNEKSAAAIKQEHSEMARLRYKHALAKVKLEKDKADMLSQLKSLEREDRAQRQKSLSKMPANMFQPAHRRIEMASEQQREMEGAFERLFVRTQGSFPRHSIAEQYPLTPGDHISTKYTPNHHGKHSIELTDSISQSLEYDYNRIARTRSPKATPDSGIHGDLSTHTQSDESGKTYTTLSVNSASSTTGQSSTETSNLSGTLVHNDTSTAMGLTRKPPLHISSPPPDESQGDTSSQPFPTASHHRSPKSATTWTLSHDIPSGTDTSGESEGTMAKTMFTQTERPHLSDYLVSTLPLPERPQLTATDVTSSDDQSSEIESRLQRRLEKLEGESSTSVSSRPVKRGEGMKTLLSMIHSQQQTWNEQMRNRQKSSGSVSATVPSSVTPSRPVEVPSVSPCLSPSSSATVQSESLHQSPSCPADVSKDSNGRVIVSGKQQLDTLSIYTFSTRESTMSPDLSPSEEFLQPTAHMLHDAELSISPYNTTLETSVLPTMSENRRTNSEPGYPTSILTRLTSTVSGSTPLNVSDLASGSSEQVMVNPSLPLSLGQTSNPPANTTVQTSTTPVSLLVTSFQPPLEPAAIRSGSIQTAQSQGTQLVGSSNIVPTSLFGYPSLLYSTAPNSLGETVHRAASSPVLQSTAVSGDSVDNSCSDSFEQLPQFPFGHTEPFTTTTAPHSVGLVFSGTSTEPSTLSLRYDYSTLDGSTSQQDSRCAATGPELVDSHRHSGADQTAQDSNSLSHFEPVERPTGTDVSSFIHDENSHSTTSEDEHITSQDGENSQLSIHTLDTSQSSFSGPPNVLMSEPDHSYVPQSMEQKQTSYRNDCSHENETQEQSVTHYGSSVMNVYSLDTIEEEDTDSRRDVDNSDSFRGDRIQDDTPLFNNSLGHVRPPHQALQEDVEPFSPTVAHISPPSAGHLTDHMSLPKHSDDRVTNHMSNASPNQNHVVLEDEGFFPTSNPTLPPTISETTPVQSQATAVTTAPSTDSGLSLQEAFLKQKKMFVQKSKQRLEQIKVSLEEKRVKEGEAHRLTIPSASSARRNQSPGNRKIQSSKTVLDSGFGTRQATAKKRVVTFSSPLLKPHDGASKYHTQRTPTDHLPSSAWLSAKEKEKITKKEMNERNERFYRRLPEVRKKMEEEQRKQTEKINRDRAKCYQQKIRMKLKTQDTPTGQSPSQPAKSTVPSKPPFK